MRRVQAAEPVDARQQFVGDAVHDLADLAMDIGVQPAEIGDAGRGAHAAEKAVALDQQHLASVVAAAARRGDAGRSAAQHHHVVFAADRGLARRFGDAGKACGHRIFLCGDTPCIDQSPSPLLRPL